MNKKQVREKIVSIDRLSYADMISLLDNEDSSVVFCDEDGIAVCLDGLVSVATLSDAVRVLERHDLSIYNLVCVHDEKTRNLLIEKYAFANEEGCWTWSWQKGRCDNTECDIRKLDESYFSAVREAYTLIDGDELRVDLRNGRLSGLFVDGILAGFIGFHKEGSMGMLHVFDRYRHRGYAQILEKHDINLALADGRIPYCHVFFSNTASMRLQSKLGLEKGQLPVWWLWKED